MRSEDCMSKNHRGFAGCSRLNEESGASIVIALVFFLICAIIGSVVLTAASVQAKSVQTHQELQQAEFTMGSAAQTIGYDMDMDELTIVSGDAGEAVQGAQYSVFGREFWKTYGNDILKSRAESKSFGSGEKLTITQGGSTVYGKIVVDPDLNIKIDLSLDENFSLNSPYNMTVNMQCIPTYNASGKLVSFSYERAVITKTSNGDQL